MPLGCPPRREGGHTDKHLTNLSSGTTCYPNLHCYHQTPNFEQHHHLGTYWSEPDCGGDFDTPTTSVGNCPPQLCGGQNRLHAVTCSDRRWQAVKCGLCHPTGMDGLNRPFPIAPALQCWTLRVQCHVYTCIFTCTLHYDKYGGGERKKGSFFPHCIIQRTTAYYAAQGLSNKM